MGLLAAGASRVLRIEPPIRAHEKPLLIAPDAAFTFEVESPNQVSLHNHGEVWVAYVLTIVPAIVANATMLPWGKIVAQLQKPGGPEELLDAFLDKVRRGLLKDPNE
jgi:hypothetical protein